MFNRLVEHFEQINLDGLLEYLTRYYAVDVERELDDFYLAEGELVFISRRKENPVQARVSRRSAAAGRHRDRLSRRRTASGRTRDPSLRRLR